MKKSRNSTFFRDLEDGKLLKCGLKRLLGIEYRNVRKIWMRNYLSLIPQSGIVYSKSIQ
jgi:hypothetical protein